MLSTILMKKKSEESNFDNPSFPCPPSEPPDADFELDVGEEVSVVMNDIDVLECLNPKDEFDASNDENDDYFPFMFVIRIFTYLIYPNVFSFLLSAESEDIIFDPESHVESNFVESLSNHDALIDSSQKIDHLEEFYGPLMPIHIAEEERIKREHAEYISQPPDADFELDVGEEVSVVMNDIDVLECLNPKDEFDASNDENDDYFPF
nr:hypothetical protein [Tanacetum cinerariifolium]